MGAEAHTVPTASSYSAQGSRSYITRRTASTELSRLGSVTYMLSRARAGYVGGIGCCWETRTTVHAWCRKERIFQRCFWCSGIIGTDTTIQQGLLVVIVHTGARAGGAVRAATGTDEGGGVL